MEDIFTNGGMLSVDVMLLINTALVHTPGK